MSPRPKGELARDRSDTIAAIMRTARQQMATSGIAGLSLRGIARDMGITAPAIYNYFPRLEDLLTALTLDAFGSLAGAMGAAEAATTSDLPYDNVMALCLAYREWALHNPTIFQLLYGAPVPGYRPPGELTRAQGPRPFAGLFRWFAIAYFSGGLTIPPEYATVPPEVAEGAAAWRRAAAEGPGPAPDMPDALLALLMSGWARIHGAVLLELFGHLAPLVGDGEAFYRYELEAFAERLQLAGRPARNYSPQTMTAAPGREGEPQ